MLISFIVIIVIAIFIGATFVLALEDGTKELIGPIIGLVFVLGFNIAVLICSVIPDLKSQAIKDYTAGKYRKEVTYKTVQKDSLMVLVDSTIIYKPIKDITSDGK